MNSNFLKKVSVIGQGYVGFPLAVSAFKAGYTVVGYDISVSLVNAIRSGESPTFDVSKEQLKELLNSKRYLPTTEKNDLRDSEIFVICVPTPLDDQQRPDLNSLKNAVGLVAENLKLGDLIIIESTIAPGTTREILLPLIMKTANLEPGDFKLVYSPERIDPLNQTWNLSNTPKLISGLNNESISRAIEFYSKFVANLHVCDSFEIAETAKLLENTFRLINISFINEISIFCRNFNVDINKVIDAAATKPYGYMPFYPSIGIGGHCIPVDPLYLAEKAQKTGAPTNFIDLATKVNLDMPKYFVNLAEEKLVSLKGKRILVVGVSYKPDIADVRETPVAALITGLRLKEAEVFWHDDLVKNWNGEHSISLGNNYDLVILATPHNYLDLSVLGDVPILNTRETTK